MPLGLEVLLIVLIVTAVFALAGYLIDKSERHYEREQQALDSAHEMEKVTKQNDRIPN